MKTLLKKMYNAMKYYVTEQEKGYSPDNRRFYSLLDHYKRNHKKWGIK